MNLLPLGCTPALLSLKTEAAHRYDHHGCLRGANKVSKMHNTLLGHKVAALRKKYTDATFYYGDLHGVYTDVLKNTTYYGMKPSELYFIFSINLLTSVEVGRERDTSRSRLMTYLASRSTSLSRLISIIDALCPVEPGGTHLQPGAQVKGM